jgi:hypothetical protein
MVLQAWAEPVWVNAYNNVKPGDKVYKLGELLGVASGVYTRCTATSPGSVHLDNMWINGPVIKIASGWELKS